MAIREYKDRVDLGQIAQMLVARRINVQKWINNQSYESHKVYFDIEFNGANAEELTNRDL